MSMENDFLELLQCEFSTFTEKAESVNEGIQNFCQYVMSDLKKWKDNSDKMFSGIEEELAEARGLKEKTIDNQDLKKNLLGNGASLKLKHETLLSQNSQLREKVLKKTAKLEREKASVEARKQNIETKRLVIKSTSELFHRILGLEVLVLKGSRMQFLFKNLLPDKPDAFGYVIVSLNDMMYSLTESYPKLDNLKAMEDALNKTNDIGGFIQYTRSLLKNKLSGSE